MTRTICTAVVVYALFVVVVFGHASGRFNARDRALCERTNNFDLCWILKQPNVEALIAAAAWPLYASVVLWERHSQDTEQ